MFNKLKNFSKVFILVIISFFIFACTNNKNVFTPNDKDIVILFTNDIHCGLNDNVTLSGLIKYYNDLDKENVYKALVDAGDFSQGDIFSILSKGELLFELMDILPYDVVVPGNHEFDYTLDRFLRNKEYISDKIISSNFKYIKTNKNLLTPYKIMNFGNKKVAFIGVSTPETIVKTNIDYFKDYNNKLIFTFCEGDNGNVLYKNTQKYIDECKNKGADYIIVISHLGEKDIYFPYNSQELIKHIRNVDFLIDGHSHSIYEDKYIDIDGKEVLAVETGTKLQNFGKLTITKDGKIKEELINKVDGKDEDTQKVVDELVSVANELLDEVIYKNSHIELIINDKNGKRLIRNRETNFGDFVADAFKYAGKTDVAVQNGGAIRDNIVSKDIKIKDLYKACPFANDLCTCEIKGKDLLDLLEFGAKNYPEENGAFYQVSGINYTINSKIPSSVKLDNEGAFINVEGEYRVKDVLINGKPLDLDKLYTLTATTFIIDKCGDGASMLKNVNILNESFILDIDSLIKYMKVVDLSIYKNILGDGRIKIK